MTSIRSIAAVCFPLSLAGGPAAAADNYPVRPMRMIAPYPPGGGVDTVARVISLALSESLRTPIVVENRAGASGRIGTELVAKAPADGYTLLLGSVGPNAVIPAVSSPQSDTSAAEFAPVSLVASSGYVLLVHPSVPAKSIKEFIVLAKARPGQLNYATTGSLGGPHLAGELFGHMAGIRIAPVNYKGGSPQMIAVIGGEVPAAFTSLPSAMSFVTSGKIRALGVTSGNRSPTAPDIPAIGETVPGYEVTQWWGVLAPAGTPKDIVQLLQQAIVRAVAMEKVKQQLLSAGAEPATNTPEQFGAHIQAEIAKWRRVAKATGLRPE